MMWDMGRGHAGGIEEKGKSGNEEGAGMLDDIQAGGSDAGGSLPALPIPRPFPAPGWMVQLQAASQPQQCPLTSP